MGKVRVAFLTAGLTLLPAAAWAQTSTTSTSAPATTTTTVAAATTTTTTTVTRIEDLVCSEPVNNVATCVDPQGRIVTRIDEPRQVEPHGDVVARDAPPAQPTAGRDLALTG